MDPMDLPLLQPLQLLRQGIEAKRLRRRCGRRLRGEDGHRGAVQPAAGCLDPQVTWGWGQFQGGKWIGKDPEMELVLIFSIFMCEFTGGGGDGDGMGSASNMRVEVAECVNRAAMILTSEQKQMEET